MASRRTSIGYFGIERAEHAMTDFGFRFEFLSFALLLLESFEKRIVFVIGGFTARRFALRRALFLIVVVVLIVTLVEVLLRLNLTLTDGCGWRFCNGETIEIRSSLHALPVTVRMLGGIVI